MLWKEIKTWAKTKGYNTSKNENSYSWSKISDSSINGEAKSVSKLAIAIYNNMTDNKWLEYQQNYDK